MSARLEQRCKDGDVPPRAGKHAGVVARRLVAPADDGEKPERLLLASHDEKAQRADAVHTLAVVGGRVQHCEGEEHPPQRRGGAGAVAHVQAAAADVFVNLMDVLLRQVAARHADQALVRYSTSIHRGPERRGAHGHTVRALRDALTVRALRDALRARDCSSDECCNAKW